MVSKVDGLALNIFVTPGESSFLHLIILKHIKDMVIGFYKLKKYIVRPSKYLQFSNVFCLHKFPNNLEFTSSLSIVVQRAWHFNKLQCPWKDIPEGIDFVSLASSNGGDWRRIGFVRIDG